MRRLAALDLLSHRLAAVPAPLTAIEEPGPETKRLCPIMVNDKVLRRSGGQSGLCPGDTLGTRHQAAVLLSPSPQTCAKFESYLRTRKESSTDDGPTLSIEVPEDMREAFRWRYNRERPHRSLQEETRANLYSISRNASALESHRVRSARRVLRVSSAGSADFHKRKMPDRPVPESKSELSGPQNVIIHHAGIRQILGQLVLGPIGTWHGIGAKRVQPRTIPVAS